VFLQAVQVSPDQFDQLFNLHQECAEMSFNSSLGLGSSGQGGADSLYQSTQILQTFMHILTPPQLIIFFQWVERYGEACLKI